MTVYDDRAPERQKDLEDRLIKLSARYRLTRDPATRQEYIKLHERWMRGKSQRRLRGL